MIDDQDNKLTGHLLVAMPGMSDPRFVKSVVYLCSHEAEGAMGLVINRVLESFPFSELLTQLEIPVPPLNEGIQVHFGGPVETGRGFVLHSADYMQDSTLIINEEVALTATVDIVRAIAEGRGPNKHFLALGYAGWAPGQLDGEIRENGWLTVEADSDLLFSLDQEAKWDRAMAKIGVDAALLSIEAGNA